MVNLPGDGGSARAGARRAADSPWLERLARVGYAVNGLLHVLIGVIALQLATGGGSGESADQSGALSQVAEQPLGRVVLWVGVAGFAGLALWQLAEAAVSRGADSGDEAKRRGISAGKAVVYLALAWTTLSFARGGSTSSGGASADVTATLMESGPGRVLVGLVGLGVVAVGAYQVHKGATKKFLQDLRGTGGGTVGTAVVRLGMVGYVARGSALVIVGVLFVLAAVRQQPGQATGLDGALRTLGEQPFGRVLLALVALGFIAYGLYSFARARYARL